MERVKPGKSRWDESLVSQLAKVVLGNVRFNERTRCPGIDQSGRLRVVCLREAPRSAGRAVRARRKPGADRHGYLIDVPCVGSRVLAVLADGTATGRLVRPPGRMKFAPGETTPTQGESIAKEAASNGDGESRGGSMRIGRAPGRHQPDGSERSSDGASLRRSFRNGGMQLRGAVRQACRPTLELL